MSLVSRARFQELSSANTRAPSSLREFCAEADNAGSVLAGALFSLAGALQSSRVDLNGVLKGCEPTVSRGRRWRLNMRDMLIAVQVTLSVVLLVSAALLARGMVRGQSAEPHRHPQCAQHRVWRPRQHRLRRQTDW